jgi:hypothetical protein
VVTAYPVANKAKSLAICRAFVEGCNGLVEHAAKELRPGVAFFYGVDASNEHLWQQLLAENRPYLYCDNSFFDHTRQTYFRIAWNRLQHSGEGVSNGERWRRLGVFIKPWRETGEHIVICPQSDHFMRVVCREHYDWLARTRDDVARLSPRVQRVRAWSPDKSALAATLEDDLAGAHALVTHSSAAAITAILNGVPAIVTSDDCAAKPMAGTMAQLEAPPLPSHEARWQWASVLADNQWTIAEMTLGVAWSMLEPQR